MSATLLLVEDSPEIVVVVRRYGTRCGYVIHTCGDAPSTATFLEGPPSDRPHPDLILLDLNLPGESGIEICRTLTQQPGFSTPIALFSHSARIEELIGGFQAGAGYFVSKDLLRSPEQWKSRIDEILAHTRRPGICDPSPQPPGEAWNEERRAALQKCFKHPQFTQLDPALQRFLMERAYTRVFGKPLPREMRNCTGSAFLRCIAPEGSEVVPQQVHAFARELADGTWRLLGTVGGGGFLEQLARIYPDITEDRTTR